MRYFSTATTLRVRYTTATAPGRQRSYLYTVFEFIEGQSLAQWVTDNPRPDVEAVRNIIEQVAKGLQAMHRQEMLHQDLRPNNIMIDTTGTVKIIDFGAVRVAGITEIAGIAQQQHILGTLQYTAPEYFIGELGTARSDLFSLGVIAYQMLSGRQPYGTSVARATTPAAQRKLTYKSYWMPGGPYPPGSTAASARRYTPTRSNVMTHYRSLSTICAIPTPATCGKTAHH